MEAGKLVVHQLRLMYGADDAEIGKLGSMPDRAEQAAVRALSGFENKYFKGYVDPLNGVMYTNYLYWLSRFCYEDGQEDLAAMVYGLNKMLHAVDLFYAIKLPDVWSCEHPLGTVMGRAEYGERFYFYQGCTVGGSDGGNDARPRPVIGDDVTMYSNSKVLGNSNVGNGVIIAANAYVINQSVPDNSIVFGQSPNLTIVKNDKAGVQAVSNGGLRK